MYARCIHALFTLIIGLSSCFLSGAMIDGNGNQLLFGSSLMGNNDPGQQNLAKLEKFSTSMNQAQASKDALLKRRAEVVSRVFKQEAGNVAVLQAQLINANAELLAVNAELTRRLTDLPNDIRIEEGEVDSGSNMNTLLSIIDKLKQRRLDGTNLCEELQKKIDQAAVAAANRGALETAFNDLKAAELRQIDAQIASLDEMITGCRTVLVNVRTQDNPTARAIIAGIAGQNARFLAGVNVDKWYEGLGYGVTFAIAQGAGNAIQNSVKSATGRIIGEPIEAAAGKVMEWLTALYYNLVHNGVRPYDTKKILGTSNLVNVTFEDLGAMLRDGFKDATRAADVTLRSLDDAKDTNKRQTGWSMLVGGYIRQFDIILGELDRNVEHYPKDSTVAIYVTEIKERIGEVQQLLAASKTLRELDDLIDANKGLITALRKNIKNLFDRLIEQIDPGKKVTMMSTAEPSRGYKGYGKEDDDTYPHAYAGA